MATPPPPPGFVLEQDEPPPPPPGFVLEAPNRPQSARFTGALAQGLSFAAADEATSALFAGTVGTGKGVVNAIRERDIGEIPRAIGNEFLELQKFQRGERDAFRREHPAIALGAEVAGGLATGGVGVLKAAGPLAAAGTGAIQGGLYGVGAAEGNLLERADDGAKGAAFGAAAGAAFQQVASKVSRFWTARAGKTLAAPDEKRAFELLTNSLAEDLGGRSKAEAALRIWMKNGAKPEELFDLGGPVTQNLYREIASRKPTPALEFINSIKSQQGDDLRGLVSSNINKRGGTVRASRDALKFAREQQAAPLFRQASQTAVPDGFVDDLIAERPAMKAAVQKAARELANSQEATPFEVLKVAKENLDDRIGVFMRAGKSAEARRIMIVRDELRTRLTKLSPDYAKALDVWSGSKAADDALELGTKLLNPGVTADDVAAQMKTLTASEREFAKVGLAEQIENMIDRTGDSSNLASRFSNEAMRKKIRTLFADDPNEAEAFIQLVKRSEDKFRRLNEIAPNAGSQTEPRLRARELFEQATRSKTGRAAEAMIDDPLRSLPRKAVRETSRVMSGNRADKVSDVLAQALFEGVPFKPGVVRQPPVQIPYSPAPALAPLTQNRE